MTERTIDSTSLFQSERQRQIAEMTFADGRVEVASLAEHFGVTTETIRRDLSDLQEQKLVRRVHGGGVPWEQPAFEPKVSVRADQHDDEKRRLARRAIAELPEGRSIIIDSGSTLTRFAEAIPDTAHLHIVTNCLPVASCLAEHRSIDVFVTGGELIKDTLSLVDQHTIEAIEPLRVDTLFISSDAATAETGLTTPYRHEAALKRAMIRSAQRVVALVDHFKFGADEFIRFAAWSDIDVLVTNNELDEAIVGRIEATGVTVALA